MTQFIVIVAIVLGDIHARHLKLRSSQAFASTQRGLPILSQQLGGKKLAQDLSRPSRKSHCVVYVIHACRAHFFTINAWSLRWGSAATAAAKKTAQRVTFAHTRQTTETTKQRGAQHIGDWDWSLLIDLKLFSTAGGWHRVFNSLTLSLSLRTNFSMFTCLLNVCCVHTHEK